MPALQRAIKARAVQFTGYLASGLPNMQNAIPMNIGFSNNQVNLQMQGQQSQNGQAGNVNGQYAGNQAVYAIPSIQGHLALPHWVWGASCNRIVITELFRHYCDAALRRIPTRPPPMA